MKLRFGSSAILTVFVHCRYAPCLVGFEGHHGNRTPKIVGIAVHSHNSRLVRDAAAELACHSLAVEHENRRNNVRRRWKKIFLSVLTDERLKKEYGAGSQR
jgi:Rad4 beta-hairpin domain 3